VEYSHPLPSAVWLTILHKKGQVEGEAVVHSVVISTTAVVVVVVAGELQLHPLVTTLPSA